MVNYSFVSRLRGDVLGCGVSLNLFGTLKIHKPFIPIACGRILLPASG